MAEHFTKDYIRFVVCIDVPKNNVNEAYADLRKFMEKGNEGREDIVGWETTNEAYSVNKDGFDVVSPDDITQAIVAFDKE